MSRTAGRAPPAAAPLFSLDTFKDPKFRVESLVSRLAEPALQAEQARRPASAAAGADAAVEAISGTCSRLLEQFERRALHLTVAFKGFTD